MEKRIPTASVAMVREKIERMNTRAGKLGLDTRITLIVREDTRAVEDVQVGTNEYGEPLTAQYEMVTVEVDGESPVLNGWHLVARIEDFEGKNLVSTVPGETVNERFRTVDPTHCEHCNTKRWRTATFVVKHEDGREAQVGRQCLRDFLGHESPEHMLRWAEWMEGLNADLDAIAMGSGGWGERVYLLDEVLVFVAQEVRNNGWVSRGKARDTYGLSATADVVMRTMEKARQVAVKEQRPEDFEMAERVLTAAQEQLCGRDDLNDYEYNLSVLVCRERPIVTHRTWGIGCSVIAWYQNQQEREREAAVSKMSEHIGTVGDKMLNVPVTITGLRYLDTVYGVTTIVTMQVRDSANVLTWFASRPPDVNVGDECLIRSATIKKHDIFNNVKQTVVTRAKLK